MSMNELELEAPPGFEPGMEVLQTSALPLGDGAPWTCDFAGGRTRIVPQTLRAPARVREPARRVDGPTSHTHMAQSSV